MITVRKFEQKDLPEMARIWNQVVEEGVAFPQKENLTDNDAKDFFEAQTVSAVAVNELGEVKGLFILDPNNVMPVLPLMKTAVESISEKTL